MAIGFGVLGVFIAHHPMILSGFRRIQTDLVDTRLIHYLLEHGYRWVRREPLHQEFWSPPFFYPVKNAAAYSDVLLGVGPVYWLWRALGASPDLSFGLWMLSMSALNYAAGLLLFRSGFGFGVPAGVAGASLVAFGAPRLNQLTHQQLLPTFYPLLALFALARLAGPRSMNQSWRTGYWLLAAAAVVAQLYTAVYLAWFLVAVMGLALVVALFIRACRDVVVETVFRDYWAIAAAGAGGLLLLVPFLAHYLSAAREVQSQHIPLLTALHPTVWSWFDVGPGNWFWGWVMYPGQTHEVAHRGGEDHLGLGMLTPIACVIGLYLGWNRPICRLAAFVSVIVWLATTVPGTQLAVMAAMISCYCAGGLFHEVDRPAIRGLGLAVVTGLLLLVKFPNPLELVLALTVMILCLLEIGRTRGSSRALIAPGIAFVLFSIKLFTLDLVLYGLLLAVPAWVLMAYYWGPHRPEVAFGTVVWLVLVLIVVHFSDQPAVLIGTLAGVPISLALSASRRYRPPGWLLLEAMLIALALMAISYGQQSLWHVYSSMIPGGTAIRVIERVVLILLVPAALGLACLVEFIDQRRWTIATWAVVLLCLAEQGVTTETFDAAANRRAIARLASRIDRGRAAFYYHSIDDLPHHHLDAMWASLASGEPTVNGYSGHAPRSWQRFFFENFEPDVKIGGVLTRRERIYGLPPNDIQLIGSVRPEMGEPQTRPDLR